jgi:hypothetical protein
MATRRHILKVYGTKPESARTLYEILSVTDHDINRLYFVGTTGSMDAGRIIFVDRSEALRDDNVWSVSQKALYAPIGYDTEDSA